MTRLLSRPIRATKPPDVLAATTLPVATTPPASKATPNSQVTKQLQGSIQQFLRQERIITFATYSLISLILITLALVFGFNYLHAATHAASSTAIANPTTPPGALFTPTATTGTLVPGVGATTPTAVASPAATKLSTSTPTKKTTPTTVATATATPQPTATVNAQVVLAIDVGGTGGGTYQGDVDYDGGKIAVTTHAIDTSLVSDSPPATVWQTARAGTSLTGTSFTYTLRQLTPGTTYTVRLGFAEFDVTGAGQRQFNVTCNNQPVLTNFDIIAQTGAAYKAIVESFTATTDANGQITLVFSAGKANVATVSSIEVVTTTPSA